MPLLCHTLIPLVVLLSEDEAKLGARRLARCLQKLGFKVRMTPLLAASAASQSAKSANGLPSIVNLLFGI